jgi:hypothetical protein
MVIPTPFVASVMAQVSGAISEDQVRSFPHFLVQRTMNLVSDNLKVCFEYHVDKTHLSEYHVLGLQIVCSCTKGILNEVRFFRVMPMEIFDEKEI